MHMPGSLTLGSYGAISEGCTMNYSINEGGNVDFMFGNASLNYFEFGLDAGSLREFVRLGIKALREMDTQAAPKNAQDDWQDGGADGRELVTTGERSA
jgi:hypothetical protein